MRARSPRDFVVCLCMEAIVVAIVGYLLLQSYTWVARFSNLPPMPYVVAAGFVATARTVFGRGH